MADVQRTHDGPVVAVRRGKTDQEDAGRVMGIPYGSTTATCPVRAVADWLELSGIAEGALFRPIDRHGNVPVVRRHIRWGSLFTDNAAAKVGL